MITLIKIMNHSDQGYMFINEDEIAQLFECGTTDDCDDGIVKLECKGGEVIDTAYESIDEAEEAIRMQSVYATLKLMYKASECKKCDFKKRCYDNKD